MDLQSRPVTFAFCIMLKNTLYKHRITLSGCCFLNRHSKLWPTLDTLVETSIWYFLYAFRNASWRYHFICQMQMAVTLSLPNNQCILIHWNTQFISTKLQIYLLKSENIPVSNVQHIISVHECMKYPVHVFMWGHWQDHANFHTTTDGYITIANYKGIPFLSRIYAAPVNSTCIKTCWALSGMTSEALMHRQYALTRL